MLQWTLDTFVGGVAYDLIKYYVLGPLMVAALASTIIRVSFQKLKKRKEMIAFAGGTFFLFVVLFVFLGAKPQAPNFVGGIQQVMSGPYAGGDRDTITEFTIGIANTGGMQSVVTNWSVEATISGTTYKATIVPVPSRFTFNNIPRTSDDQPESVTFKSEDSIVEKGLSPVQPGAFLQGVLFVVFRNLPVDLFKGPLEYTVRYGDVLSRQYSMPIKSTGHMDTMGVTPGLHTELVCRVPPGPLPNLTTGSIPNYSPVPAKPN